MMSEVFEAILHRDSGLPQASYHSWRPMTMREVAQVAKGSLQWIELQDGTIAQVRVESVRINQRKSDTYEFSISHFRRSNTRVRVENGVWKTAPFLIEVEVENVRSQYAR